MRALTVAAAAAAVAGSVAPALAAPAPIASLRLHNPTRWAGPAIVEAAIGQLAAPGLIDWRRVRLLCGGREVPFALREGAPHWRARLAAPVRNPRAEDLLVFTFTVPPGGTARLDLVPGRPARGSALRRRSDRCTVTYPDVRVTIDRGLITAIEMHRAPALSAPMSARLQRIRYDAKPREGGFGPWSQNPVCSFATLGDAPGQRVDLVASASTPAMTELHYLLHAGSGPAMGLTYRIHAAGSVEICADERPWSGPSPWVDHAATFVLPLAGQTTPLPDLENRAPLYGFSDYLAAVRLPAAVHHIGAGAVVALGEETINGRKWLRTLTPVPGGMRPEDAVEVATEGLVVETVPRCLDLHDRSVTVAAPPAAAEPARLTGIPVSPAAPSKAAGAPPAVLTLQLVTDPAAHGIVGDGYAIRPAPSGAVAIAGTLFGLTQAALRIAAAADGPDRPRIPLIAANPAVNLRAGGFGGGDFEVDFPYGTDAEWRAALAEMIAGGMNVMGDLGMWSNWKMPVAYRYMPEIKSDAPDAYDEVSGCRFADMEASRTRALEMIRFLHARGVRVWLWLPIGAVPTTYARKHPEAMAPGSDKFPCHTHPAYAAYLDAFLRELLETYPIDGVVMIRDDNGGICGCDRCRAQVAASPTHSAAWEQYLALHANLRKRGFTGDIAVYPYYDSYEPGLDPLIPPDLYVVGHGAGLSPITRNYERTAPMGDAWIDNYYAAFRLASTSRMRRLLSDRGSFWIGGAFTGTELPWLAVGQFGAIPSTTVNTLRSNWAARALGRPAALPFVALNRASDRLWDAYARTMLPQAWMAASPDQHAADSRHIRRMLADYEDRLVALRSELPPDAAQPWIAHVSLLGPYVAYHLRRLEALSEMTAIIGQTSPGEPLPEAGRTRLGALRREVYRLADAFERQLAAVPGNMMARSAAMRLSQPFREWAMGAYGFVLERTLKLKQFDGAIEAGPLVLEAGKPFRLRITLRNRGLWPWAPGVGHRLTLTGDAPRLGLPASWEPPTDSPDRVYGDVITVDLAGVAPNGAGQGTITLGFHSPIDPVNPFLTAAIPATWR